jgi:hypothetical protein
VDPDCPIQVRQKQAQRIGLSVLKATIACRFGRAEEACAVGFEKQQRPDCFSTPLEILQFLPHTGLAGSGPRHDGPGVNRLSDTAIA